MATPCLPAGATTGDSGGELSSGEDSGDMEFPQSPDAQASRSLGELFEKAAEHLQGLVHVASREQLLYLYARYKQVKIGKCNTPKPGFFDFEGKQKWEAWKALGDSSPQQAMQEYIATVKKLDPAWNPQTPEKKGKETNSGLGGPVVSSLYHEETIRTMKVRRLFIMLLPASSWISWSCCCSLALTPLSETKTAVCRKRRRAAKPCLPCCSGTEPASLLVRRSETRASGMRETAKIILLSPHLWCALANKISSEELEF
uniref:acyl-CoA-binding domain-containing protein 6 isoform X3 n=1 Tax=Jaculus jaculus TaxID=51337 RepID=UPI001E1B1C26|nr:acyl-CoA-binding domain-containing protein 6 isoform X3 [Jaculus jaculus]